MNIDDLSETPDIDFLLACRDGDVDAFAALYARHAPTVLRYAWSRVGDRSLAEEVLQDTFTTAWAKRRSADIVDWLKAGFGMDHGHANALVGWTRAGNVAPA